MKAIILAAGMGTRMGIDFPKSLLKINERTLLEHHVTGLRDIGVEDIYVVTGFAADQFPQDLGVTYVHNDAFEESGNAHSFLLALGWCGLDDHVVVLDGDLLLDHRIYFDIEPKLRYFIDILNRRWVPGEIGIKISPDNRIVGLGREYEYGTMLGLAVYSPEFLRALEPLLLIAGHRAELVSVVNRLVSRFAVEPCFVRHPWIEVDTSMQYEEAVQKWDNPTLEFGSEISPKELASFYVDMKDFSGLHVSMRNTERDQVVIQNSTYIVVRENGRVVGCGRYFTDGAYAAAIYDVMVRPSHQGKGIGSKIVAGLVEKAEKLHPVKVFLLAEPGKEGFYQSLGFGVCRATAMERRYDYDRFSPNWQE
ncbi:GNAT family N-acetyltransferase [Chloroflexota bacterium]